MAATGPGSRLHWGSDGRPAPREPKPPLLPGPSSPQPTAGRGCLERPRAPRESSEGAPPRTPAPQSPAPTPSEDTETQLTQQGARLQGIAQEMAPARRCLPSSAWAPAPAAAVPPATPRTPGRKTPPLRSGSVALPGHPTHAGTHALGHSDRVARVLLSVRRIATPNKTGPVQKGRGKAWR